MTPALSQVVHDSSSSGEGGAGPTLQTGLDSGLRERSLPVCALFFVMVHVLVEVSVGFLPSGPSQLLRGAKRRSIRSLHSQLLTSLFCYKLPAGRISELCDWC